MRAADVAGIVGALVIAGGAGGGFFYWRAEQTRAEAARYEAAVDALVDSKIQAVGLGFLAPVLAPHGEGRLEALRALYADQTQSDRLNMGFGTLRGDWRATYTNLAEQAGQAVESDRLQREVDERYGPGAFTLMNDNYEFFLDDAPRRQAEMDARQRAEQQATARALDAYMRQHGRFPQGAFRIVNGRVVED